MDFLIGAVTGGIAALTTSIIIYQSHVNKLLKIYKELTKLIRGFNDEYNRQ